MARVKRPADEIEITLAMAEAGTEAVCAFDRRFDDIEHLAAEVYEAMEKVRRKEAAPAPIGSIFVEVLLERLHDCRKPVDKCGILQVAAHEQAGNGPRADKMPR